MRARGAEITTSWCSSSPPTTGSCPRRSKPSIHAKAADVPIIVAVNKMDRPDANPERVLQQLSERGLVPEQWGGDTIVVQISALQGTGIDDLLEQLLIVAEGRRVRASPEGRARGGVLEAEPRSGPWPGGDGHRGERHAARR